MTGGRAPFTLRPFTAADAREVATWRYPSPFDLYDAADATGLDPPGADGLGYYAIVRPPGELVGFCCLGSEGRVPGQDDEPGTLDVGMGVRPDLVSSGVASAVLPLLLRLARDVVQPDRLRTAVAAFNERSLRLCARAGFVERRRFAGPQDRPFVELVLELG